MQLIKILIAEPLSNLINTSFEEVIYLDQLKISKVLLKDGNRLDRSNYRPISLLSNKNKILEKLMHKRLYSFLSEHNCIYINQFGFRKNHSTTHAIISLTEEIRNALDNNDIASGVFVDLKKAFDTVEHSILVKTLDHYGIRGIANDSLKSYLSNRMQYVSINGHDS